MSESEATPLAPPSGEGASRGAGLRRVALIVTALGALLSVVAFLGDGGMQRYAYGYLLGFVFCWSMVLGSIFFVALQHVTGSVWSIVLRRIAEMFASPMWILGFLFIPLIGIAFYADNVGLFPWSRPELAEKIHGLGAKAPYLDTVGFMIRAAVFFVIWTLAARIFVRGSLKQDGGNGSEALSDRMRSISGPFIVLFGFSLTVASFDWLMSIEPSWYSTIYGIYVFSGVTLSGLAIVTIGTIWVSKKGWLPAGLVRSDHLYSLGALMFAFTCFWTYIAFSQYMLIWYGNIPEETVYFIRRGNGGWGALSMVLVGLRFVAPFILLLARGAKSNRRRLVQVAVLILVGQLVDLYWLIMPQLHPDNPGLGWQELAGPLFVAGVVMFLVSRFLDKHSLLATGDPLLQKSKDFHL